MPAQNNPCKRHAVTAYRSSYSFFQGTANASTLAFSVSEGLGAGPAWIITTTILGFASDSWSSYFFQGDALTNNFMRTNKPTDEEQNAAESDNDCASLLKEKPPKETELCHIPTIIFQLIYTLVIDLSKILGNRYFFLTSTRRLLEAIFEKDFYIAFMASLSLSLIIKLSFLWSNETYDANRGIAEKFGKRTTPIYHKPLQALTSKTPNFFIGLGSLEHALIDGVLPIFVFTCMLPQRIHPDFISAEDMADTLLLTRFLPASITASILILIIHAYQTYFFEGADTRKNLSLPQKHSHEKRFCCNDMCGIYALKFGIQCLMPIFHGIKTFDAIFFPMENFLETNHENMSYIYALLGLAIVAFSITSSVTYFTEVKAAADELEEHIQHLQKRRSGRGQARNKTSVTQMSDRSGRTSYSETPYTQML